MLTSISKYISYRYIPGTSIPELILLITITPIDSRKIKVDFSEYNFTKGVISGKSDFQLMGEFWMWESETLFQFFLPNNGFFYGINNCNIPNTILSAVGLEQSEIEGIIVVKYEDSFPSSFKSPSLLFHLKTIGSLIVPNYEMDTPSITSDVTEHLSHGHDDKNPQELFIEYKNDLGFGVKMNGNYGQQEVRGNLQWILHGIHYSLLGLPPYITVDVDENKHFFEIKVCSILSQRYQIQEEFKKIRKSYGQ